MSLSGIFKNILLVICSVLIWHVTITPIQLLGYSITLCALVYYAFGQERIYEAYLALIHWSSDVAREVASKNGGPIWSRKGVFALLGLVMIFMTGIMFIALNRIQSP
jgi:drug/metabolite transporter (DMT)-like permease